MIFKKHDSKGAVLTLVLYFVMSAFAAVSVYFFTARILTAPSIRRPSGIQAVLNARSGVLKALSILKRSDTPIRSDSLKTDSTASKSVRFGDDMFEDTSVIDTVYEKSSSIDYQPSCFSLYDDSSYGLCSLSLTSEGKGVFIRSLGMHRRQKAAVFAELAGAPFKSPDTVLYLTTSGHPEGSGNIRGYQHNIPSASTSADSAGNSRFEVNPGLLAVFMKQFEYEAQPLDADSGAGQFATTVRTQEQFDAMPDNVTGHLVLENRFGDTINGCFRKIHVSGKLQIQGSMSISKASFIVEGDAQILDNAELRNAVIFSSSNLFISGKGVFEGTAIAGNDIEVLGNASILNKSLLICRSSEKNNKNSDSTGAINFAVHIRDQSTVDAVVIDVARKGIECSASSKVKGVLWSLGPVCCNGPFEGVIRADRLSAGGASSQTQSGNTLEGRIVPLEEIASYQLPFFIGTLTLSSWRELRMARTNAAM
jgi:hypothetical protein